ncbi:MAG: hypothetical protein ACLTT1_09735 [[Clostridium] scindens]
MANVATSQVTGEGGGLSESSVRKVLEAAGVTEDMLSQYGISIEDIVKTAALAARILPSTESQAMCWMAKATIKRDRLKMRSMRLRYHGMYGSAAI